MSHAKNEDDDVLVLNFTNDAVISQAISPEFAEICSLEGMAKATRVFEFGDAISHERR